MAMVPPRPSITPKVIARLARPMRWASTAMRCSNFDFMKYLPCEEAEIKEYCAIKVRDQKPVPIWNWKACLSSPGLALSARPHDNSSGPSGDCHDRPRPAEYFQPHGSSTLFLGRSEERRAG